MRMLLSALVVLLVLGCASTPVSWRAEPDTIVVRNNSGVDLAKVSLRAPDGSDTSLASVGEISPVPRGSNQVFRRRSDPPPLPSTVDVTWTDRQGRHSRNVSLDPILDTATGEPGERLVFEIRPAGDLAVYCEPREK